MPLRYLLALFFQTQTEDRADRETFNDPECFKRPLTQRTAVNIVMSVGFGGFGGFHPPV